jgi:hypothetical protein
VGRRTVRLCAAQEATVAAPAPPDPTSADQGRVQRADLIDDRVVLELFAGERQWLILRPDREAPLARASERPKRGDETPPAAQKLLRAETVPGTLETVEHDAEQAWLAAHIALKGGKRRVLVVEADPADPRVLIAAVKDKGWRVLGVLAGAKRPTDGRDVRKGRLYERPRQRPAAPGPASTPAPPDAAPPSRDEITTAAETGALRAAIKRERKRLGRLKKRLDADLFRHGDPDALAAQGEALKAVLHAHRRGMTEITGPGPDGAEIMVALDAARSGPENLERLFHRARRARAARDHVAPRRAEVLERLETLATLGARALDDDDDARDALRALLEERSSGGGHKARLKRSGPRLPYRTFICAGDVPVRVGRSARDNDALTFHIARGNDTWMHCRDVHGSHVILPVAVETLGGELLLDAAHLAAWFSEARGEARVDVQYTAKKHVRKPGKGAAPGAVHHSFEKVMHLVVDEARVKALLGREIAG